MNRYQHLKDRDSESSSKSDPENEVEWKLQLENKSWRNLKNELVNVDLKTKINRKQMKRRLKTVEMPLEVVDDGGGGGCVNKKKIRFETVKMPLLVV